jgi:putative tricarboxylic transport membrane protein
VGLVGLWAGRSLEIGDAAEMGPGYVPRLLCLGLLALGLVIALSGMRRPGARPGGVAWRPLLVVTLAVLAFAATLERLGLVVAVIAAVVIASAATPGARHRETAIAAVVLAGALVLIFITGLGLPVPALPRFDR